MTTSAVPAGRRTTHAGRGFWPMRDLPVVLWLLATAVVAVAHPLVPAPRWLLIHLTLLGAVTHSILVWSRYFTDTLLRAAPDPSRSTQARRLALLDVGVLMVLTGVVGAWWPVTVVGGTGVALAVAWHGATLLRALRSALAPRFGVVVRYYLAAAAVFPVGIVLGVLVARVRADPWHDRLLVAHAAVNLLGWVGLTVTGTLVTLWPTMLRTRIATGIERTAARTLPVLLTGIVVTAGGALAGQPVLGALGLAAYLGGVLLLAPGFLEMARRKPPTSFSAASALGAVGWLTGALAVLVIAVGSAGTWSVAGERFSTATPYLATGFGAQILLGALSYLVPVALGGGPRPVAAATGVLDRAGLFRVVVLNASLVVTLLPAPAAVRALCSALALLVLAAFLPLLGLAIRASLRARHQSSTASATGRAPRPPGPAERPPGTALTLGLVVVLCAAVGGLVVDRPLAPGNSSASAGVRPTGETTKVKVEAEDMRFTPATLEVPVGNRLVIELTNTDDEDVHDLVLDDGTDSGRLSPGESTSVEVPVVGRDMPGWCSVLGHRQMGMVLQVRPVEPGEAALHGGAGEHSADRGAHPSPESGEAAVPDPHESPAEDFTSRDAALPPLTGRRVHRRTFHVSDTVTEVAPGVTQALWTYNGTAPGPTLHGRVGDRFVITLVNDGSIGHSIDFHAGALAPDGPMRTLPPGESLTYRFTATRAGIWMYHCSTMPMSAHIANGLFGAVVIEPADLPPADRSWVLVQSEIYLGPEAGTVDMEKVLAEEPDLVTFNGYADQYDHRPLQARVGERLRIWVLDAGPNRSSAFHVIGGQFDTVYREGAYALRRGTGGSQTLGLLPSQGGFVELELPEAGRYPFVSHIMVDGERGAHGIVEVTE